MQRQPGITGPEGPGTGPPLLVSGALGPHPLTHPENSSCSLLGSFLCSLGVVLGHLSSCPSDGFIPRAESWVHLRGKEEVPGRKGGGAGAPEAGSRLGRRH